MSILCLWHDCCLIEGKKSEENTEYRFPDFSVNAIYTKKVKQ